MRKQTNKQTSIPPSHCTVVLLSWAWKRTACYQTSHGRRTLLLSLRAGLSASARSVTAIRCGPHAPILGLHRQRLETCLSACLHWFIELQRVARPGLGYTSATMDARSSLQRSPQESGHELPSLEWRSTGLSWVRGQESRRRRKAYGVPNISRVRDTRIDRYRHFCHPLWRKAASVVVVSRPFYRLKAWTRHPRHLKHHLHVPFDTFDFRLPRDTGDVTLDGKPS